jgi:hypothetical protein
MRITTAGMSIIIRIEFLVVRKILTGKLGLH